MSQRSLLIGFLLILASVLRNNVSSSPSTSTSSTTPRSPFSPSERTRVSGFGARHTKRSIFKQNPSKDEKRLYVYKDDNVIWLQDTDREQPLCISVNKNGAWVVQEQNEVESTRKIDSPPSLDDDRWIPVEGIYGFYKIPSGILLVLIARTESVFDAPSFCNHKNWWNIHKVKHLEVVHLPNSFVRLTPNHVKEEVRQLRLFRKSLKQHELYCCHNSTLMQDMTKPLQASFLSYNNNTTIPRQAAPPDPRFFWNQVAVDPIISRATNEEDACAQVLLNHIIPLTSAYVGVQSNITCNSDNVNYTQILISRRSRFRAGTRFTRRGADASGAVANYAETEQVTLFSNTKNKLENVSSHVQVRGSIPIRWSSPADVKTYRPKVRIGTDPLAQARALRWHLLEQQSYYADSNEEDIIFVNLVDKKSDQGRLGRAFDEVLKAVTEVQSNNSTDTSSNVRVQHIWYDFHAQVKNGKWDRLSILLKDLKPYLVNHGYFSATATGTNSYKIESKQKSMVRTNCMDCLDRTNVVQSILARLVLFQQMDGQCSKEDKKKFLKSKQLSLPWDQAEACHRALWADNADEISRLYAGTPALKRDFTRTGKRTKMGALDDGMNSLQRYYLNNFLDADRQEGMDLMVGYAKFSNVGGSSLSSRSIVSNEEEEEDVYGTYAARRAFLGNLFGHEHQEGASAIALDEDEKDALDLRWVPGDLQDHLRSQADDNAAEPEIAAAFKTEKKQRFEFSSSKALKAMDQRSTSDLPWWSLTSGISSDDEENSSKITEPLDPHQRHPITMTKSQVLGILIMGFRSPKTLSTSIVGLLGALYLKEILQHDMKAAGNVKERIEERIERIEQQQEEAAVDTDGAADECSD